MTNELTTIDQTYGAGHSTLASYTAGFFFSVMLTLIPYEIVREQLLDGNDLIFTITMFALLQLAVQLIFFLHLSTKSKARWNLIAIIFTILMVSFLVIGTIWIMKNLSYNMSSPLKLNNMMNLPHGD